MKSWHLFLLFLLLTLNKYMLAGKECFNLGSPILVIKSLLQQRDLEIIWLWVLFVWLNWLHISFRDQSYTYHEYFISKVYFWNFFLSKFLLISSRRNFLLAEICGRDNHGRLVIPTFHFTFWWFITHF